MCSTAWVNQFEIKDMYIEFAITNVSAQGNNGKIKLNLKVEKICRDCTVTFCEINYNNVYTKFLFSFIRGKFITMGNT